MSTATVEVSITCPDWCVSGAEYHGEDLEDMGGDCNHMGDIHDVVDRAGYEESLTARRFHYPVPLTLTQLTRLNGAPSASAVIRIAEQDVSLRQALDVANAIAALVAKFEASGGVVEPAVKRVAAPDEVCAS